MKKLSVFEKTGFASGEIAGSLIWQTLMYFLPIFYTDSFGIPMAVVGTMFFVVRLFDAINDPVMGIISDRTNTRWGKYRPYILFMSVPFALGAVLMFITPPWPVDAKIIYAYVTYILMMVLYTSVMIPYSALSGVLTASGLERTALNSYRFFGAFLGGLVIQAAALNSVQYFGSGDDDVAIVNWKNQEIVIEQKGIGTVKAEYVFNSLDWEGQPLTINVKPANEILPQLNRMPRHLFISGRDSSFHIGDWLNIPFENADISLEANSKNNDLLDLNYDNGNLKISASEGGHYTASISGTINDMEVSRDFWVHISFDPSNAHTTLPEEKEFIEVEPSEWFWQSQSGQKSINLIEMASAATDTMLLINPATDLIDLSLKGNTLTFTPLKSKGGTICKVLACAEDGSSITQPYEITWGQNEYAGLIIKSLPAKVDISPDMDLVTIDMTQYFKWSGATPTINLVNTARGYQKTMMIFGLGCIIFFMITFFSTKERVKAISDKQSSIAQDLKDLFSNRPWLIIFVVGFITMIYVGLRSSIIAYYFQYYVKDTLLTSSYLVVGTVTILFSMLITKKLTEWLGKRLLYTICMGLVGFSLLAYQWVSPTQIALIFILQILQSLGSGPTMPLLWSMLADAADYNEWKNGRKAMGLSYSAATFIQKGGFAIGGALAMWMLSMVHYIPNQVQSEEALTGIRNMMGIVPALGAFLCMFIILFYPINDAKLKQIETDLATKRGEAEAG